MACHRISRHILACAGETGSINLEEREEVVDVRRMSEPTFNCEFQNCVIQTLLTADNKPEKFCEISNVEFREVVSPDKTISMRSMDIDDPGQLLLVSLGITAGIIAVAILVLVACRRNVQRFFKNTSKSNRYKTTIYRERSLHQYDPENEFSELEELLSKEALDDEWLNDLSDIRVRSQSPLKGHSTIANSTNHNRLVTRGSINKMLQDKSDHHSVSGSSIPDANSLRHPISVHKGTFVRTSHNREELDVNPSYSSDVDETLSVFSERLPEHGEQLCNIGVDENSTASSDLANVDAELARPLVGPCCADYRYTDNSLVEDMLNSDSHNPQNLGDCVYDSNVIENGYGDSSYSSSPLSSSYDEDFSCHIPQDCQPTIHASVPIHYPCINRIDNSSQDMHLQIRETSRNISTSPSLSTITSVSTAHTDAENYIPKLSPSEVSTRLSSVLSSSVWSSATNEQQSFPNISDVNAVTTDQTGDTEFNDVLNPHISGNSAYSGSNYSYGEKWIDSSSVILKDRLSINTSNDLDNTVPNNQAIQAMARAELCQAAIDIKVPTFAPFYQSRTPCQTLESGNTNETKDDLPRQIDSLVTELGTTGSIITPCNHSEVKHSMQSVDVISQPSQTGANDATSTGLRAKLDIGNSNDTDESFVSVMCHSNEDRSQFSAHQNSLKHISNRLNWSVESDLRKDNNYVPAEIAMKTPSVQKYDGVAGGHSRDSGITGPGKARRNGDYRVIYPPGRNCDDLKSIFQNNVQPETMVESQSQSVCALQHRIRMNDITPAQNTHASEKENSNPQQEIQTVPHHPLHVNEGLDMLDLTDQTATISKTPIKKSQPPPRPPKPPIHYVNAHRLGIAGNNSILASLPEATKTQQTQCTTNSITEMSTKVNPRPIDVMKTADRHMHNTVNAVNQLGRLNDQQTLYGDIQSDISKGGGINESVVLAQTSNGLHSLPSSKSQDKIEISFNSNYGDNNNEISESCNRTKSLKSMDNCPYSHEPQGTKSESFQLYATSGLDTDFKCSTVWERSPTNRTSPKIAHAHNGGINVTNDDHEPDQRHTVTRPTHDASPIAQDKHNTMLTSALNYPLQTGASAYSTKTPTTAHTADETIEGNSYNLQNSDILASAKSAEMIPSIYDQSTNIYSQRLNTSTSESSECTSTIHEFTSMDTEHKPYEEVSTATKSVTFNPIILVQDNIEHYISSSKHNSGYASGTISPTNNAQHLKSIVKGSHPKRASLSTENRNMGTNEQARLSQHSVHTLSTNPVVLDVPETDICQNKSTQPVSTTKQETLNESHSKVLQKHPPDNESVTSIRTAAHMPRAMCSSLKQRAQRFMQGSDSASSTSTAYETATSCGNKSLCMEEKICLKNKCTTDDPLGSHVNTALTSLGSTPASASTRYARSIPLSQDRIEWLDVTASKHINNIKTNPTITKQTDFAMGSTERTSAHVDAIMHKGTPLTKSESTLNRMDMLIQMPPNFKLSPTNKPNHIDSTTYHTDSSLMQSTDTTNPLDATTIHILDTARHMDTILSLDTELKTADNTPMDMSTNATAKSSTLRHTDSTDTVSRHMDTTRNPTDTTLNIADNAFNNINTSSKHIESSTRPADNTSKHMDATLTSIETSAWSIDTPPKSIDMASRYTSNSTNTSDRVDADVNYCDAARRLCPEPTEDDLRKIAAVVTTEAVNKARIIARNNTLCMDAPLQYSSNRVADSAYSNTPVAPTTRCFADMSNLKTRESSQPSHNMKPTFSSLKSSHRILRPMKSEITGNRQYAQAHYVHEHDCTTKIATEHKSPCLFKPIDNLASTSKDPPHSKVILLKPIAIHRSSSGENSQYNSLHSPLTTRLAMLSDNVLLHKDAQVRKYSPEYGSRNENKQFAENGTNINRTTSLYLEGNNISSDKKTIQNAIQSPPSSQIEDKKKYAVLQYKAFHISSPPISPPMLQFQETSSDQSYHSERDQGIDPGESNQRHGHILSMCRGLREIYPKIFQHKGSPIKSKLGTTPANSAKSSPQRKETVKASIQTSPNIFNQERPSPNQLHSLTGCYLRQDGHDAKCIHSCSPSQNTSQTVYKNDKNQQRLMCHRRCFDHQPCQQCSQSNNFRCINDATQSPRLRDTRTRNNNASPALSIKLNQTSQKETKMLTSPKLNVTESTALDISCNTDKMSTVEHNHVGIMSPLDDTLKVSMWIKSVLRSSKRKTRTISISSDTLETGRGTCERGDCDEITRPLEAIPCEARNTDHVDIADEPQAVNSYTPALPLSENTHLAQHPWLESRCWEKCTEKLKTDSMVNGIDTNEAEDGHNALRFIEPNGPTMTMAECFTHNNNDTITITPGHVMSLKAKSVIPPVPPLPRTKTLYRYKSKSTPDLGKHISICPINCELPELNQDESARLIPPQCQEKLSLSPSLKEYDYSDIKKFKCHSQLFDIQLDKSNMSGVSNCNIHPIQPADILTEPPFPPSHTPTCYNSVIRPCYPAPTNIISNLPEPSKCNISCNGIPSNLESFLVHPSTIPYIETPCREETHERNTGYPVTQEYSNIEPTSFHTSSNTITSSGYEFDSYIGRDITPISTYDTLDIHMPHNAGSGFITEPPTYDDVVMEFTKYNLPDSKNVYVSFSKPETESIHTCHHSTQQTRQFHQWPDLYQKECLETEPDYHLLNKPEQSTKDGDLSEVAISYQQPTMSLPINFSPKNTELSAELVTHSDSDYSIGTLVRKEQYNLETTSQHSKTWSTRRESESSCMPVTDPSFSDRSAQTTVSLISMGYEGTLPQMDDCNTLHTSDSRINILSSECNARNRTHSYKANSPNSSSDESDTSTGTVVLASASLTSLSTTQQMYPCYNKQKGDSIVYPTQRKVNDFNHAVYAGYSIPNDMTQIQVCKDDISSSSVSDSKNLESSAMKVFIDLDKSASMSTASESYYTAPSSVSHTPTETLGYPSERTDRENKKFGVDSVSPRSPKNHLAPHFLQTSSPPSLQSCLCPKHKHMRHREFNNSNSDHNFNFSCNHIEQTFECVSGVSIDILSRTRNGCQMLKNSQSSIQIVESILDVIVSNIPDISADYFVHSSFFNGCSKDEPHFENESSETYIDRKESSELHSKQCGVVTSETNNTNNSAYMCVDSAGMVGEPYFVDRFLHVPEKRACTNGSERRSPLELSVLQCMVYSS